MALAIAREFDAHVDGLYVDVPVEPPPMYPASRGPAMTGLGVGSFGLSPQASAIGSYTSYKRPEPDAIFEATRSRDHAASSAKTRFEQMCHQNGVSILEQESEHAETDHPVPSASFRREVGLLAQVIGRHACTHDMMVTACAPLSKETKEARAAIEAALLHSGRPVLLAPARPPDHVNGRVLVAWNDSPQCWHALSTALPFLAKAKEVVLFHAGEDRIQRETEEKAAEYLAWHGVEAEVAHHEPGPGGIANYLMSQCSERGVDLMVMGAYSHSPLRERILGGVTHSVLRNAAATPVLMMH